MTEQRGRVRPRHTAPYPRPKVPQSPSRSRRSLASEPRAPFCGSRLVDRARPTHVHERCVPRPPRPLERVSHRSLTRRHRSHPAAQLRRRVRQPQVLEASRELLAFAEGQRVRPHGNARRQRLCRRLTPARDERGRRWPAPQALRLRSHIHAIWGQPHQRADASGVQSRVLAGGSSDGWST